ncbi:ribosomal subunit interface protein [Inquilinus ginsengisoli]|uniref:Ribosome hibernation promoting factor n=1 Tax=Inquilinus ginsengisoli TaxID=363840 RepID=A0ABU1JM49_9PROT|nr:ribosome-associated translation inhibitor RaiA [Inquilinus ginsengisoli]MDR6289690.1 ribosomal subunit interface protein [Inquilinus ginsengisoli]
MQLTVRGKQIDVGDALRTHVSDALTSTTAKYFNNAIEANVVFSRNAHLIRSDLSVHVGRNILLQSNAEAESPYHAFDAAANKLAKRLRRYKRRLRDHHNGDGQPSLAAQAYILEAESEEIHEGDEPTQPIVIADVSTTIESLTVLQAVMRLDLGDLPALMFRNQALGRLNMVFRRPDGNIGWVDPKGNEDAAA